MIINFPLAYENILEQADALLEKSYIDHAIVLLEDTLGQSSPKGEEALLKKLLTCYLLKEDLESAEAIILQLTAAGCLDLSVAAHHIIIGQWLYQTDSVPYYKKALNLSPPRIANLSALVYELKDFYESQWSEKAYKNIAAFLEADRLEGALEALSGLEGVSAPYFEARRADLECYLAAGGPRIEKALLFLLLGEKTLELAAIFEGVNLRSSTQMTENFHKELKSALRFLEGLKMDINHVQWLSWHLSCFFYHQFPNHSQINTEEAIYWLSKEAMGLNLSNILDKNVKHFPKKGGSYEKVSEYLASLSL